MSETVVALPKSLRSELKEPMGRIFTDPQALLDAGSEPIIAVGDIVTYHLLSAGHTPAVALVDDQTKRSAVDSEVHDVVIADEQSPFDQRLHVDNPAATLTAALLDALVEAVAATDRSTLVVVDGEEDLAVLPAVLAAPTGASVVYGQPDEGMVLVDVDDATRQRVRSLLEQMDGDTGRLFSILS